MKKGIHRGLGLLLAIVVVAMLAACSTKDSVSEVPDKDDSDAKTDRLQRQISSAVVTKQSGYATKQTGYFWTKQLGLNNCT